MFQKYRRHSIRLKDYDYSKPGAYFITICTKDRKCLFGEIKDNQMFLNEFGEIAKDVWLEIPNHFPNVELDEFVIMPNHIHGIIIIQNADVGAIHELPLQLPNDELPLQLPNDELPQQMSNDELPQQMLNDELSRQDNKIQRRKMIVPKIVGFFKMNTAKKINQILNTIGQPLWQRNYYEHIIRKEKSLQRIRQYIINNPAKWDMDMEYYNEINNGE